MGRATPWLLLALLGLVFSGWSAAQNVAAGDHQPTSLFSRFRRQILQKPTAANAGRWGAGNWQVDWAPADNEGGNQKGRVCIQLPGTQGSAGKYCGDVNLKPVDDATSPPKAQSPTPDGHAPVFTIPGVPGSEEQPVEPISPPPPPPPVDPLDVTPPPYQQQLNNGPTSPPLPTSNIGGGLDAVLKYHNDVRAIHGGVPALVWSTDLQGSAQAWADNCVFQHSGPGENLAMGYTTWKDSLDAWYAEGQQYDYNAASYSPSTGHFTQMVWAGTTQLGCGVNDGCQLYVCQYRPYGNVIGSFKENVFPASTSG